MDRPTVAEPEAAPCCAPVVGSALGDRDAHELAELFKALADPARLRALSLVANAPDGEMCACDLVEPLDRSQPTVSHHMAVLVDAGFVAREKRGRWTWYRLVPERLDEVRRVLGVTSD
jgi:ArsR family transcriptional regulator